MHWSNVMQTSFNIISFFNETAVDQSGMPTGLVPDWTTYYAKPASGI